MNGAHCSVGAALVGIDDPRRAGDWCETVMREAAAAGYPVTGLIGLGASHYGVSTGSARRG